MNFLAISGSTRRQSTNTALLEVMAAKAPAGMDIRVFPFLQQLPVFSQDLEGEKTPEPVRSFIAEVEAADGLIISSPEYVHAIPGGLKNAIDWLVSGEAVIDRPIVLTHASSRGEDMLASLRLVLRTVSANFNEEIFRRFPLLAKTPAEIRSFLEDPEMSDQIRRFLGEFENFVRRCRQGSSA
ncbi:MAG: NAD(P)H-dependent oxidoreductase [Alphaproteobacteria bacterium]|nr:MAG: NAD(P)H-dependent oxidoreductase [Alphaproteobacteria bacterium]